MNISLPQHHPKSSALSKMAELRKMKVSQISSGPGRPQLAAYQERAARFRDPKTRKKTLWSEIANQMRDAGFLVDCEGVDRKIRNMRKTFKTIKDNQKRTGSGRVKWEYFDKMDEIFTCDRTINCGPSISSMISPEISCSAPISLPPTEHQTTANETSEIILTTGNSEEIPLSATQSGVSPAADRTEASGVERRPTSSSLNNIRRKQLSLEEQKVQIADGMYAEMKETNRLC